MTLNSLEVTKCCTKFFLILFLPSTFSNFYILFLELFFDEHAMVLRYSNDIRYICLQYKYTSHPSTYQLSFVVDSSQFLLTLLN